MTLFAYCMLGQIGVGYLHQTWENEMEKFDIILTRAIGISAIACVTWGMVVITYATFIR